MTPEEVAEVNTVIRAQLAAWAEAEDAEYVETGRVLRDCEAPE